MEHLSCRKCGTELNAANIDRQYGILPCLSCGAIFDLKSAERGPADPEPSPRRERRNATTAVPRPMRFSVEHGVGSLAVKYRWFNPILHLFMLFFCVAWDGFLIFWYSMALGRSESNGFDLMMVLFPMVHVAVGLGLTYSTLAGFLNTTRISVSHGGPLIVTHSPLPWKRPSPILPGQLEQLYVQCKITTHRRGGTSRRYLLCALLKDGSEVKLISNFEDVSEALYLEHEFEKVLGIFNRPVPGEWKGD